MEKIISNKAASFASMELARFALERADQRASSILEQYRKSTDRNYTLAGFIMTVFMALTAFLATEKMTMVLIAITLPLWVGTGTALLILFCKVMWVHDFMALGDDAATMLRDDLVDVAMNKGLQDDDKANDEYLHHLVISSIRHTYNVTEYNRACLNRRNCHVKRAMTAIITSVIVSATTTVIMLALSSLGIIPVT